jgi:hypothetical protein
MTMARGDCTFRQRDLRAALKAVEQSGAKVASVNIKPDGTIVVVMGEPPATAPEIDMGTDEQWLSKK